MWTTENAKQLFEKVLKETNEDILSGNYSTAQFPRTGQVAFVELITRVETINWVLEMLPTGKEMN